MKKSLKYREIIADARRVVVKIGSRVLVQKSGHPDIRCMHRLIKSLAQMQKKGYEIVIVTSGAIGAGMEALKMKERPVNLPDLQMAASIGQPRLMSLYDDFFSRTNCMVGQILLTHADFHHKIRLTNARRIMENLLKNKVIPIINENDVVADEEIRADLALGDNDYLASLVVKLIRADLLIILTTVDGVRERGKSERTHRVRYIESVSAKTFKLVSKSNSPLSKGGMTTKLKAAQKASKAGCSAIIANGRQKDILKDIMTGKDVGTIVLASGF